jgi:hypothetical protein
MKPIIVNTYYTKLVVRFPQLYVLLFACVNLCCLLDTLPLHVHPDV